MKLLKLLFIILLVNIILEADENNPTKEEVAKLYVATFNRAPDSEGLDYWVNSSGLKLSEIAQSFFDQPETQEKYPSGTSNRDFIQTVYNNLFNRTPDTLGWDYWEGKLNSNEITKNRFLEAIINAALDNENGQDKTILDNKNEVGLYFANAGFGINDYPTEIMSGITSDSNTVSFIKGKIDSNNLSVIVWDDYLNNSSDTTETINHAGFTYGIVTSPITGRKWLDRNLGASVVCTKSRSSGEFTNDADYVTDQEACFGDYYQWGRLSDGHEKKNSPTSNILAKDYTNAGTSFITNYSSSTSDWIEVERLNDGTLINEYGNERYKQWSKTDGTSICPLGFRVPTKSEYEDETEYDFLKFPNSGIRSGNSFLYQGRSSIFWTNSTWAAYAMYVSIDDSFLTSNWTSRYQGNPVRCIKN